MISIYLGVGARLQYPQERSFDPLRFDPPPIPRRFRSDVVRVVLTARGEELMPSGSGGGCGSWLSET
jgi:hypothetical protein